jgi:hypothetical protein
MLHVEAGATWEVRSLRCPEMYCQLMLSRATCLRTALRHFVFLLHVTFMHVSDWLYSFTLTLSQQVV